MSSYFDDELGNAFGDDDVDYDDGGYYAPPPLRDDDIRGDGHRLQGSIMNSMNSLNPRSSGRTGSISFGSGTSAAVAATIDLIDIPDDEYDPSLFGKIADLTDACPGDIKGEFISLFGGSSQICNRLYGKDAKIDIFREALGVENSILLGDNPPLNLQKVCTSYRMNATKHRKWKVGDIAGTVFDLTKNIRDREEQSGRPPTRNTKIRALVTMYDYFNAEIYRKEAERKTQMEKATSLMKPRSTRPPPQNFKYSEIMVCTYHHESLFNLFTHSQFILVFIFVVDLCYRLRPSTAQIALTRAPS